MITAATQATRVALPGAMLVDADRRVRVTLPLGARSGAQAIVERVDGAAAWLALPIVDEAGDELVLAYPEEPAAWRAFPAAVAELRRAPAVHLPEVIALAQYVDACVRLFERHEIAALVAPACLRYAPDREGGWRLLAMPLAGVALADWAHAAPDAWAWTPSRVLLGEVATDAAAYAVGAALHTALVGELTPPGLAPGRRFRRALVGWIGDPGRVADAVRAALPASFTDEAAELAAIMVALLEPSPPSDWRERLDRLAPQLSAHRVAVRWEYEGRVDIARQILDQLAARAPDAVPWDAVVRLRSRAGDLDGALDAALAALAVGDPNEAVRELVATCRRIAHATPPERHQPMIARAVAAVARLAARLDDDSRLHVAHLEARYLGRFADALARLDAPAGQPWTNVVRETLAARSAAARAEWPRVARACKQARLGAQAMPDPGGPLSRYVLAYLDFLDGVAHTYSAATYADPGYLADAFERLVRALDAARTCAPDDPLIDACVHALHWLGERARALATTDLGIAAYLSVAAPGPRTTGEPPLVWYDASRLLALSGAP